MPDRASATGSAVQWRCGAARRWTDVAGSRSPGAAPPEGNQARAGRTASGLKTDQHRTAQAQRPVFQPGALQALLHSPGALAAVDAAPGIGRQRRAGAGKRQHRTARPRRRHWATAAVQAWVPLRSNSSRANNQHAALRGGEPAMARSARDRVASVRLRPRHVAASAVQTE